MKFTVEFTEDMIRVTSGSDVQYATEVAFGFNGMKPVVHMTRELGDVPTQVETVPGFQYLDGST